MLCIEFNLSHESSIPNFNEKFQSSHMSGHRLIGQSQGHPNTCKIFDPQMSDSQLQTLGRSLLSRNALAQLMTFPLLKNKQYGVVHHSFKDKTYSVQQEGHETPDTVQRVGESVINIHPEDKAFALWWDLNVKKKQEELSAADAHFKEVIGSHYALASFYTEQQYKAYLAQAWSKHGVRKAKDALREETELVFRLSTVQICKATPKNPNAKVGCAIISLNEDTLRKIHSAVYDHLLTLQEQLRNLGYAVKTDITKFEIPQWITWFTTYPKFGDRSKIMLRHIELVCNNIVVAIDPTNACPTLVPCFEWVLRVQPAIMEECHDIEIEHSMSEKMFVPYDPKTTEFLVMDMDPPAAEPSSTSTSIGSNQDVGRAEEKQSGGDNIYKRLQAAADNTVRKSPSVSSNEVDQGSAGTTGSTQDKTSKKSRK